MPYHSGKKKNGKKKTGKKKKKSNGLTAKQRKLPMAVSYTHLTLPTIYSV